MSIVKRHLAEQEERLVLVEEICIDKGALVLDVATDEVYFSADDEAYEGSTDCRVFFGSFCGGHPAYQND